VQRGAEACIPLRGQAQWKETGHFYMEAYAANPSAVISAPAAPGLRVFGGEKAPLRSGFRRLMGVDSWGFFDGC